jgi:uncharacterized membrane protein YgdD (TMEM256/DUF423 family)
MFPSDLFARLVLALAGLLGAAGVAAAAAASHADDARIFGAIALIGLAHAPALIALSLMPRWRPLRIATAILGLGALLFILDLGVRHFAGGGLFPLSAPIGGTAMIIGWLGVTLSALVRPGPRS